MYRCEQGISRSICLVAVVVVAVVVFVVVVIATFLLLTFPPDSLFALFTDQVGLQTIEAIRETEQERKTKEEADVRSTAKTSNEAHECIEQGVLLKARMKSISPNTIFEA
eukprot:746742-Hanusia_phi.AAC.2